MLTDNGTKESAALSRGLGDPGSQVEPSKKAHVSREKESCLVKNSLKDNLKRTTDGGH